MHLDLSQFRLLLVGPKISRLLPFIVSRGYVAEGCLAGSQAVQLLRREPRHLLLVELELEDMLLADLLQAIQQENLAGAVVLLEDPAKSGMIVSLLARGVDAYVATPPEESILFRIIERQLLAQWAMAQSAGAADGPKELQRLANALQSERATVAQLLKDAAVLRAAVLHAEPATSGRAAIGAERLSSFPQTVRGLSPDEVGDLFFEEPTTEQQVRNQFPSESPGLVHEESTRLAGWEPPLPKTPAAPADVSFDESATMPEMARASKPLSSVANDGELFIDVEEALPDTQELLAQAAPAIPNTTAAKTVSG